MAVGTVLAPSVRLAGLLPLLRRPLGQVVKLRGMTDLFRCYAGKGQVGSTCPGLGSLAKKRLGGLDLAWQTADVYHFGLNLQPEAKTRGS